MAAALLVCLAVSADPQCPPQAHSCFSRFDGGQHASVVSAYQARDNLTESMVDTLCSHSNWDVRDRCLTHCPLRLEVTEPAHLRVSTCLTKNWFSPHVPDLHIDLNHPLNGVELDLVSIGDSVQSSLGSAGCTPSDFATKDFTGKMVLAGGSDICSAAKVSFYAQAAGALSALFVSTSPSNSVESQLGNGPNGGSTGLTTFPAMGLSNQLGEVLMEAVHAGNVKARVVFSCDLPGPADHADLASESCPMLSLQGTGTCNAQPSEPDTLSAKFPARLSFPGSSTSACLWGNRLVPRRQRNLLQDAWQLPRTAAQGEVVLATELSGGGCAAADFTGLAGKVVLLRQPVACTIYKSVRLAEAGGVTAYVVMASAAQSYAELPYGPSEFVGIPVHAVGPHDALALLHAADLLAEALPGVGHVLRAAVFSKGELLPVAAAPPQQGGTGAVPKSVTEVPAEFEWSVAFVVCLVIGVLEVLVLVGGLVFRRCRRQAGADDMLPKGEGDAGASVPLELASAGLSASLVLVVTVVGLSLTMVAGQEALDSAQDDGRETVDVAHELTHRSVDDLSRRLRGVVVERISNAVSNLVFETEAQAAATRSLYLNFNGTWASFDAVHPLMVDMAFLAPYLKYNEWGYLVAKYQPSVYTTQGFFGHRDLKTDSRPEAERWDGISGSVATTNAGWPYGITEYWYDHTTQQQAYSYTYYGYNATRMLGGNYGDPVAFTQDLLVGSYRWHVSKTSFPQVDIIVPQPASVFTPLYNKAGLLMGALEMRVDFDSFAAIVSAALVGGSMQNMTVLIVDPADGAIFGTNAYYNTRKDNALITGLVRKNAQWYYMTGIHTMSTHPAVRVKALSNYLQRTDGWTRSHSGEMEQQEEWSEQDLMLVKLTAVGGSVVDVGTDNWDAEMRDGTCGKCVVHDDQLGKEVLMFDGQTTLYLYTNLTTRVPSIARTRTSAAGQPWASSRREFSETLDFSDGTECIAHTDSSGWLSKECMQRDTFAIAMHYTISMRVRPDTAYTGGPESGTPRLFSDAITGEGNVALFANGELHINTISYGCRAVPVSGGVPARVWTTVGLQMSERFCAVYLNGTLVASGKTTTYSPTTRGLPYYIGRGFAGRMDSLMMFNLVLTPAEMMSLHTDDRLVREVPKQRFFVDASSLNLTTGTRHGADWASVSLVPRDDIMRAVDHERVTAVTELAAREEATRRRLGHKTAEVTILVAVLVMTSVLVLVLFNWMLTKPLARTAELMVEVAFMRVEALSTTPSFISEVRTMNKAMEVMLGNLRLYKSFMPQTLQLDDMSSAEEEVDTEAETTRLGSSRSRVSRASHNSSHKTGVSSDYAVRAITLQKKRFSFVVININKWHETVASMDDKDMIAMHACALDLVVNTSRPLNGIAEVFSGDKFACSFNAVRRCASHRTAGCKLALECANSFNQRIKLGSSASVVSGEARVGNMGSAFMKRFSFVSPVLSWAYGLERYCRSLDFSVVVDQTVYADVGMMFRMRIVDTILFTKLRQNPVTVAQLLSLKQSGVQDEWMYELGDAERSDEFAQWNRFMKALIKGDCLADGDIDRATDCDLPSELEKKYLLAVREGQLEPTVLRYH